MMDAGVFDMVLAEILSARICHELINPVGAIANGLEILEDEPGFADDAGQLIGQSVRAAARRLQFFRVAYGSTVPVPLQTARDVTLDLFAESKIDCDWPELLPNFPHTALKLVCNLLLMAAETLPRGGRVILAAAPQGSAQIFSATAIGVGARLVDPQSAMLGGRLGLDTLNARTVQTAFTVALAQRSGWGIQVGSDRSNELHFIVREAQ